MPLAKAEAQGGRWAWAIPLLALALALAAMLADPLALRGLRNASFDQYQRWHPRSDQQPPVRIIDIDDESLRRLGQWPWTRSLLAELLTQTHKLRPAAVALDIMFPEREQASSAAGSRRDPDTVLAQAIAQGPVAIGFALKPAGQADTGVLPDGDGSLATKASVLATGGDPTRSLPAFSAIVPNLPELQDAAAGQGAITLLPDVDGIVRKVPLLMSVQGQLVPSLAAEALRLAGGETRYTVHSEGDAGGIVGVRVGLHALDTDAAGSLWVHYAPTRPERYIPAWKILAGQVPEASIKGHIVLVGTSAQGLLDLRFSPLGGIIPGVEVHAQALEQVLSGQALSRPGWAPALELLVTLVLGALVGAIAMKRSAGQSAMGFLLLSGMVCAGAWAAFVQGHVLFDASAPTLALALVFIPTTVTRHLLAERRQRWMKQTFSRYVSPNLVEYLVAHPGALELGGRRQQCSFVFTDLAGFTRLMETMDPATAVSVLNGYLDRMIAIAFENEGTLDRIVGDAVAIVFSAPIEQADHQQRALRCALQMREFARSYVNELAARGVPFCETRIGVHSGEVTVGNFGGETIFDYRALGDPVNTASRLEGANKHLGTLVCVSEATLTGCSGAAVRPIGRLRLAGRSSYLMAFEPLAADGPDRDFAYEAAYSHLEGDAAKALAAFEALAAMRPEDALVRLHLARIRAGKPGDAIDLVDK